jgi:tRNA1Val (adenine37-N6)-methyltransferase
VSNAFQFKQFLIEQDKCSFKVGTDSVLLGAWANVENATHIIDIGTGSGILSLMVAQRCNATITAIESDEISYAQALENFKKSPWNNRITAVKSKLQDYIPEQFYDNAIANPPYFDKAYLSDDQRKNEARHTESLNLSNIFSFCNAYMLAKATVHLVLPIEQLAKCIAEAEKHNFYLSRLCEVISMPGKNPKRHLLSFTRNNKSKVEYSNLTIEKSRNVYTDEYLELCKDYYVKF